MSIFNCNNKCSCVIAAIVISAIIGVITAFLQITAVITVAPAFLWVALGIAVVYLGVLVATSPRAGSRDSCGCTALNVLLAAILGTILVAVTLLAVGIVATSVVSAILVGLLLFGLSLTLTSSACLVRSVSGCGE